MGLPPRSARPLTRVAEYAGEREVFIAPTQLEGDLSAGERKRVLRDWIEFLSGADAGIVSLVIASRVPQELLDALVGQSSLRYIELKWGPYRDLGALTGMRNLHELVLGGATGLESLGPLSELQELRRLTVSDARRAQDATAVFGSLTRLVALSYGSSIGTDRSIVISNLEWLRKLIELQELSLAGTRILDADLSIVAELPKLLALRMPLRRSYRAQVMQLAGSSAVLAEMAKEYDDLDGLRSSLH